MASWLINCNTCGHVTDPGIIHKLASHCNEDGWFVCSKCKQRGHIKNTIQQHEKKEDPKAPAREPYLLGLCVIVRQDLQDRTRNYYPFVFWVGNSPEGDATNMWFCYYKDTRTFRETERRREGNFEIEHGPDAPPVLYFKQYAKLIKAIFEISEEDSGIDVDIIVEQDGRLTVIDRETI